MNGARGYREIGCWEEPDGWHVNVWVSGPEATAPTLPDALRKLADELEGE